MKPKAKVRRWLERTVGAHPTVRKLEVRREGDDAPVETLDVPPGQARDWVWELSDDVADMAEHFGEGKLAVVAVDTQGQQVSSMNVYAGTGAMVHADDDEGTPHESIAKIIQTQAQQNTRMAELCLKSAQSAQENHRELVELVHEMVLSSVKGQLQRQREVESLASERQERELAQQQFTRSQSRKDKAVKVFTERLGPDIMDRLGIGESGDAIKAEFIAEIRLLFESLTPKTQGAMLSELPEEQAEKLKAMLGVS